MINAIITIGIVLIFIFLGYKYVKFMKNKHIDKPHCGGCK